MSIFKQVTAMNSIVSHQHKFKLELSFDIGTYAEMNDKFEISGNTISLLNSI